MQEEPPVVFALAGRFDCLVESEQHVAVELFVVGASLGPVGGREDEVGQLGGGGHVEVLRGDELEVRRGQRLVGEVGVLVAQKRVVGDGDERLHRARLAGDHGLEHGVGIVGAAERLVQRMLLAAVGEHVGAAGIDAVPQRDLVIEHDVDRLRELHAAFDVDVSQEAV